MNGKVLSSCIIILLAMSANAWASSSVGTSESTSRTEWRGLLDYNKISTSAWKEIEGNNVRLNITYYGAEEDIAFYVNKWALVPPKRSEYVALLSRNLHVMSEQTLFSAYAQVRDIYLRSPNKQAVALNESASKGTTSSITAGATISSSSSSSVNYAFTTCDENMKYKGFSINCQTGFGNGADKSGVSYEFINWKAIKAEGVRGPVRWRYQDRHLTVAHIAKGTEVTFAITGNDIRVVSADNLVSFKRDMASGNLLDTVAHNMTRKYLDVVWKNALAGSYGWTWTFPQGTMLIWHNPLAAFYLACEFVGELGSNPEWAKKQLASAADMAESEIDAFLAGDQVLASPAR